MQPETPFASGYAPTIRVSHPEIGDAPFAPETLTRIIEDCARYTEIHMGHTLSQDGAHFWTQRQAGHRGWEHWPLLTVYLDDDGKVRFQ